MEHIWTILMLKILHAHLFRTFVANSKIDAIYALYPESLSDKNLAVRKVFAFSDSEKNTVTTSQTSLLRTVTSARRKAFFVVYMMAWRGKKTFL